MRMLDRKPMSIPPRLIVGVDRPYLKEGARAFVASPSALHSGRPKRHTEGPDCGKMTGWGRSLHAAIKLCIVWITQLAARNGLQILMRYNLSFHDFELEVSILRPNLFHVFYLIELNTENLTEKPIWS